MPKLASNGIELCYEDGGTGPAVVLIMGIGAQMLLWPDDFVDQLRGEGLRVIRFDNRDVGESTWLSTLGVPPIRRLTTRAMLGMRPTAPYTLWDMASDTVGLLDALRIERAHVVGASMGGMIAQCLGIRHSQRLSSLTSIMSTTGDRRLFRPHPKALRALLRPRPTDTEAAIEAFVAFSHAVKGQRYPVDEARVRSLARRCIERGQNPDGFQRQWAAILATGNRTRALASVTVPSLVVHGSDDPLIPLAAGKATAQAIPDAQLHIMDGMGHRIPAGVWTELVGTIARHVHTVEASLQ